MTSVCRKGRFSQRGATAVEFALVAMLLITVILGIIQFGLVMFTFNSAAQATRHGARVAAVNAPYASAIVNEMKYFLRDLSTDNVVICYPQITDPPGGEYVVVRLAVENEPSDSSCNTNDINATPYRVTPWFFWPVGQISVAPFTTWLPRESLGSG